MNINVIIQGISALALLIAKYSDLIGTAQAEGRDVTDAELAALKADRKAAVDRLLSR